VLFFLCRSDESKQSKRRKKGIRHKNKLGNSKMSKIKSSHMHNAQTRKYS
jgi:hypothetical protein